VESLVSRALELPSILESLVKRQCEAKYRLCDLLQHKKEIEDQIAGEVASTADRYQSSESRRGEVNRRLTANTEYQQIEADIKSTRQSLIELDSSAARAQGDLDSTNSLINLLAAALHSGHSDIESLINNAINGTTHITQLQDTVLFQDATTLREIQQVSQAAVVELGNHSRVQTGQTTTARNPQPATQSTTARPTATATPATQTQTTQATSNTHNSQTGRRGNGNSTRELTVTVTEADQTSRGNIRAKCRGDNGEIVTVFGKNNCGLELQKASRIGYPVKIKASQVSMGWYALSVWAA
jgi:chromosome segregation ATPase